VARPLRVFGVIPQRAADEEKEESKALDVLAAFRHQVRKTAISSASIKKDVLSLCDKLRDEDLPRLGFKLEV